MTDKEIVLELTKAVIEKQTALQTINQKEYASLVGDNIATLFNTIASGIKPTLDKLATHNEQQARNN
ncbi:hypothetical protein [Campylobacter showae]|uniref:Uncharacterized protein n=1 Tax=Campylobacter showae CSUNSWCD TaxID=1244083 RepID=M5IN65_9BACT|nr:hypothetical protein [Campylobacter showae]EKU10109.1 hypothetical protein CSUNSWCD_1473 [Campylobacter showae CSUNSWCD]